MALQNKGFDEITEADLVALIEAGVPEGLLYEYKRDRYGNADADRREFLKDVSALANTFGGHLVVGMDEADRSASALAPLAGGVDQELQRLNALLQAGLEPRIIGVRMRGVPVQGGEVIVVRVPRSANPPHRVIAQGVNRFYGRTEAGAYELSVEELRRKFSQRLALADHISTFRSIRTAAIDARDTTVPVVRNRGTVCLHIIPQAAFEALEPIDVRLAAEDTQLLRNLSGGGGRRRFNVDGVANVDAGRDGNEGYCQLFRNGTVEMVHTGLVDTYQDATWFAGGFVEVETMNVVWSALRLLEKQRVEAPYVLALSILDVRGASIHAGSSFFRGGHRPYEISDIHLPTVTLTEMPDREALQRAMHPLFDALWQSAGFERSPHYDENGLYQRR